MKTRTIYFAVLMLLALGAPRQSAAQPLAQRSFDLVFQGDDPGEVFTFVLPFDPLVPSAVRFVGFFENLSTSDTSVSYNLSWLTSDSTRSSGPSSDGFVPLTGAGHLPVVFDQLVGFTPARVDFQVEGGGPSDHFRFVGEFAIQQVPEPGVFTLLGTGAILGLLCRRFRRNSTYAA